MDVVAPAGTTTLVGRDAELAELASLLGVRPSAAGPQPQPARVLLAGRRRRRQDPPADRAARPRRRPRAGRSSPVTASTSATARCPTSPSPRCSAGWPPTCPTSSTTRRRAPPRPRPAPARPPDARQATTASRHAGPSTAATLFDAVHALLAAAAAEAPLLLVIEDAHWADQSTRDMLSFLFSRPFAARSRSSSPTAPTTSTAATRCAARSPSGRGCAASTGSSSTRSPTPTYAAGPRAAPRPAHRGRVADIVDRAEGNAFFVEELVGAAWAGRRSRATSPTCCWSASTGSTRPPATVVRVASVAGRRVAPRPARRGRPSLGAPSSTRPCAPPSRPTSWSPRAAARYCLPPRAARRGGLRRPAARRAGAAPRGVRRRRCARAARRGTAAELARHAPAAPTTCATALRASIRAGDEAMAVGGPDGGRAPLPAARSSSSPTRTPGRPDVDVSALVRQRRRRAGRDRRAAPRGRARRDALARSRPTPTPTDARPAARVRRPALLLTDNDEDAAQTSPRPSSCCAEEPARAAGPGARRPRPGAVGRPARRGGARRGDGGARPGRDATTCRRWPSTPPPPWSGSTARPAEAELARRAGGQPPRGPGEPGRSTPSCARLYFLGRVHQDRGDLDAAVEVYREVIARQRGRRPPGRPALRGAAPAGPVA